MSGQVLYVDFGADNSVRLAMSEAGQRPPKAMVYHCVSLKDFDQALTDFLQTRGTPQLLGAGLSVCGWEHDGSFEMPNLSYRIEREWIKDRLNISRVHLVNESVATALAIERLDKSEQTVVCEGNSLPTQVKALIAVGRSLGTTLTVTDEIGNVTSIPCAGGHSDLPATNEREFRVVSMLARKYGHVSRARAVSTPGFADIYDCLNAIDGRSVPSVSPLAVMDMARRGDLYAKEAVNLIMGWLAATASDTALTTGARGGIFIAGSLFEQLGDLFDTTLFKERYDHKGRLSRYVSGIPVYLVKTIELELVGLSTLFG